jgi:DNA repair exonuclease SbcCD ATPase subunit
MAAKSKHVNSLVESMQELNNAKRQQYEQLQARQEELETAVADKEMHEARERELALQAQEALERAQIAEEAVEELQSQLEAAAGRHSIDNSNNNNRNSSDYPPMITAQEMSRLLSEATAKSETKLVELRDQIAKLERERTESEEEQARQLRLRAQEIERLRSNVAERQAEYVQAIKGRESADGRSKELEEQVEGLRVEVEGLKDALRESEAAQKQIGSGDVSSPFARIGRQAAELTRVFWYRMISSRNSKSCVIR